MFIYLSDSISGNALRKALFVLQNDIRIIPLSCIDNKQREEHVIFLDLFISCVTFTGALFLCSESPY